MPIVIKTGNIKYKNSNGQYVGINSVAETTTAQQVAAIQAEGAAQLAVINTKATEAEASLSSVGELEDIIAEVFNSSTPYSKGQYVIQAVEENSSVVNKLFKFIDDHNGPWLDEDVEEVHISDELSHKADYNQYYDNMSVGTADQLLSENYVEDNTPYLLRQSGGGLDIGNREKLDSIVGGTVCWNQLVTFTNGDSTSERITYTKVNGTVTANGTASGSSYINLGDTIHGINGHVILIVGGAAGGSSSTYYLRDGYTAQKYDLGNGLILKKTSDDLIPQIAIASGVSVSNLVFKPQFFDLTKMFGFTIADYVYSLEQTTAGAGVAWFRALFPNDYYAYNAGELIGVKPSTHIMTDSNNASWSYPFNSNLELYGFLKLDANNKLYYDGDIYTSNGRITRKYGIANLGSLNWTRHTDAGTNAFFQATASNRLYGTNSIILCTGFNSIIHSSSRYGFTRQEFGNTAANNSIGGLHANNSIVVRADSYTTKDSFTTAVNNIYILYELETQLTNKTKPFQELQIVDPNGTEEFADTRAVPLPVGHKTKYYTDLKAKLEPIPSIITDDFSADRDYSEGDYCWYNNILYRFTDAHPHGSWSYADTIATQIGEDISILRNEVRHPDTTLTQTGKAADAKVTGDALNSNAILFDPDDADVVTGSYIERLTSVPSGMTITYTPVWRTNVTMMESGYIPCKKGDLLEVACNGSLASNLFIPLYDRNKTIIGDMGGENMMGNCYLVDEDAAYCRIPIVIADKDKYAVRRRNYPDFPTPTSNSDKYYVLTAVTNPLNKKLVWIDKDDLDNAPLHDALAEDFSLDRDYVAGEYCWYNNILYRFQENHPHGAWNYAHCIASPIGDDMYIMGGRVSTAEGDIGKLKSAITKYNSLDVVEGILTKANQTASGGAIFTWNGDTCTVDTAGVATTGANANILLTATNLPDYIHAGDKLYVKYSTTDSNVRLRVIFRNGTTTLSTLYATANREISVPDNANKWTISIFVDSGKTVSNATATLPQILNAPSNNEIYNIASLAFRSAGILADGTDLDDVRDMRCYMLNSGYTYSHSPIPSTSAGILIVYAITGNTIGQMVITLGGVLFYRQSLLGNFTTEWKNVNPALEFVSHGVLATDTDLDTVKAGGYYVLQSGYTYGHTPFPSSVYAGTLAVFPTTTNTVLQMAVSIGSHPKVFVRTSSLGVFPESWEEIQGGDTYNNTYTSEHYENTYNITCSPEITADTNNYLASTGDYTDRTADIQAMLNSTGVCHLGPGRFSVTGINVPDYASLIGSGVRTALILDASVTTGYAVKLNTQSSVSNMRITSVAAPTLSSTVGTRHGVLFEGTKQSGQSGGTTKKKSTIDHCIISNFTGGGITCTGTGVDIDSNMLISDCFVDHCGAGIYIPYYSEFHRICNCAVNYCWYGCVDNGGNNNFSNCDFSGNRIGILIDNSTNQSPNVAHGTFSGCSVNHSYSDAGTINEGTAIKLLKANLGEIFTGMQVFYGAIVLDKCVGIRFVGANVGSKVPITITDSTVVTFSDCTFKEGPSHVDSTFTQSGNTVLKFTDCYLRDGTVYNPMA